MRLYMVGCVNVVTAVADQIDDDVFLETLAELDREAGSLDRSLRVVGVDVEHRSVEHLGDVARVSSEAGVLRRRREAYLVVYDDMDRPADLEVRQLRESERLHHQPLAGKRGVPVHQDRNRPTSRFGIAQVVLLRVHDSGNDGVHRLEVARVV
jgi:hypothetical protein